MGVKKGVVIAKDWFTKTAQVVPQKTRMVALFEQARITKSEELPELLSPKEVAEHLKMNPKTASALMKNGTIRSMKLRGRRFSTPEWLADYMRKEISSHG